MASTWHIAGLALEADWVEAWGTWVGGLGTAGTLAYALVALRRESDRRRQDVTRVDDAERKTQDLQARTVVLHSAECGGFRDQQINFYKVTMGNYGQYPITHIVAVMKHRDTGHELVSYNGGPDPVPVIEANSVRTLDWKFPLVAIPWPEHASQLELPDLFEVRVCFTDVYGIRWKVRPGLGEQPSRISDTKA